MKDKKTKFMHEYMKLVDFDNHHQLLLIVELDEKNKPHGIIFVEVPKPYLEFALNPF